MLRQMTRGFTLIELLVVIAVLAIVVAISYEAFSGYVYRQQFSTGVVQMTGVLRESRQRSLGAETTGTFQVVFYATSSVRVVDTAAPAAAGVVYDFPGIILTPQFSSGSTTLTFARLNGMPNATGTILLQHERTGATTSISINESGIVTPH